MTKREKIIFREIFFYLTENPVEDGEIIKIGRFRVKVETFGDPLEGIETYFRIYDKQEEIRYISETELMEINLEGPSIGEWINSIGIMDTETVI